MAIEWLLVAFWLRIPWRSGYNIIDGLISKPDFFTKKNLANLDGFFTEVKFSFDFSAEGCITVPKHSKHAARTETMEKKVTQRRQDT
ncbi:hypothetical protein OUZ56_009417 [Daphnia magna]|uniref:Uncharacterized protein n=1 Tax=Daphnia magna TaxID=35525 RepID=A0ABR0AFY9_9CRUS|nr:hypothetical protein OUZ56_009417 [Daphnia magna]